jgi:serine/threonine-protein kinase
LLGKGHSGVVYRGHDIVLGRNIALKLLRSTGAEDANTNRRFRHDTQIAANLRHPHIVAIHDFPSGQPHLAGHGMLSPE